MPKAKNNAEPRPDPSPHFVDFYSAVNQTYRDIRERLNIITTMENDLQHDLVKIEEALLAANLSYQEARLGLIHD